MNHEQTFEIISLSDEDLDIEELERRLELAPIGGGGPGPTGPSPGDGDTCGEQLSSWCCGGQNDCKSQCALVKVK